MFLSWWRGLVKSANPKADRSKGDKRFRVPRKFRAAVRVEQLEDRVVPFGGQANVFLNLQNAATQLNTIAAPRSSTVPVFIDFDSVNAGTTGGVGGGNFYVLYDPKVLSISETATSVGSDIKLGSLLAGMSSSYTLAPATGFSTGVVAIGLNHSGSTFLTGSPTGHLIEVDFHVVQATAVGNSTLVDMQPVYADVGANLHPTIIHDQGGSAYTLSPAPNNYATIGTTSTLTQPGALSPNTAVNPFSPNDTDAADAAIQIVAQPPNLAPTALADTYSMAPNTGNFSPTMTVAGLANGVLANDTPTANGPMNAVLTGGSVTTTMLAPQTVAISSVTETGFTVAVTTSASNTYQVGEEVTLAGVALPPSGTFNGSFIVASVLSDTQFTFQSMTAATTNSTGGTVTNAAQTLYSAATTHGNVTLNANDGSLAYTPTSGYIGTDTFTYQAVDAVSNTPSANATVTVYVGGYLSIPQNLAGSGVLGTQLVVPVNILTPNPANSGGLDDATIGINYDPNVFSVVNVRNGTVTTNAGWAPLTANTSNPGKIIITTGATGGALPAGSTAGGSLALITFNVIGFPSIGSTSVINLAGTSPQVTSLDVNDTGTPVALPLAVAPVDNLTFNGTPGQTDGLVTFANNTTTTVSAAVGGSSVTTITYGTRVTLTATVVAASGSNAPSAGSVDFRDGANDLTTISTDTVSGTSAVFTLITTPNQLQVIQANGGIHTITAAYTPGIGFAASSGTLPGGLRVTPAALTITARPNTKIFDGTTSSLATPTVSGLQGNDTVTGLAEVYSDPTVATGKTLSVSAYTVNDGNSGNNYTVATVTNTAGVINPAPGKALVSLDVGAGVTAVTAARSGVVKVFIDFDNHTAAGTSPGSNGGLAGGSFYVLYDPAVLSIGETATAVSSDIKLGSLLSSSSSFYTLASVSGFSTGVVAIGLNHSGSTFVSGAQTGHLLELDFHVVSTTSIGISSLLDLQSSFTDSTGAVRTTNIHDKGALLYALTPAPAQYATLGTASTLTQAGALNPSQFSPADTDTTDAAIDVVAGTPALAPTTLPDSYSMAPNTANFTTTMTATGLSGGVLANDTATSNGPMDAVLTGAGVSGTALSPQSSGIVSASETGNVVTITTAASVSLSAGEGVTIAGVANASYNGYFPVATVLSSTQFTYTAAATSLADASGGTISTVATTVYSAATAHGQVWLNSLDGSFAYTPTANYLGTDTFTYKAVDAASNTPSANTTVTINVGGYLSIPQNIVPSGNTVTVPVNIASGNPANSGGLTNATIGINYDASKLSVTDAGIAEGTLNSAAGWTNFTVNTNTPGEIIITTSNTGGAAPLSSTTGGSLAIITFTDVGFPTGTSVVNISAINPAVTTLDVAGTAGSGNSVPLPFAIAPVDNTNFNGTPGATDGLITFPVPITTTSTVSAAVGGSSVSTVTYGTPVTLTATVVPGNGSNGPVVGSVDFKDGSADLGTTSAETFVGNTGIFTLVTTANQLQVIAANGGVHTITSTYIPGGYFDPTTATVAGGLAVTPASLTITATTNTKTYDATTTSLATPTVAGLIGSDTVTGLAEAYTNANVGSGKTLSVSAYTINDGNGGKDYTVTTVNNTTGVITKAALTITALTNTKTYDSTTSAAAIPTVAGLQGGDTITGLAEFYTNANAGASKTLSVSNFTVNDGNGGNNYTITTVNSTTGLINKAALTITARPNTKIFDGTTSSLATPTVSGLQGNDTVTGLAEVYSDPTVATGKTLSVSAYTVSDGNSGNNYTVATVTNTAGVINPAPGKALVSLDVGAGVTAVTAARSGVVKVFIDFDNHTAAGTSPGSNGGLAGGSFYVLYDPAVLSIGETATAVSSDIKLGSLLSSSSSFYTLASVSGFSTGVVAIGLNHSGSTFVSGAQTGHLLELDFHVVSTTSIGISSLLDLQSSFTDSTGAVRTTNIHDKGALLYALTPAPAQYATLGTASTLTQAGALNPSQFSPADTDTTDAAIDVVAGTPALAPTTLPDSYSMAPNTANFTTTMTATGLSGGVLANDTATSNGPMDAVLTGAGVSGTALSPQSSGIVSASETGNVVTITTAASVSLSAGEGVTISGVPNNGYDGYFPIATVLSNTQFTYTALATNLAGASGGTASAGATTIYTAPTAHGQVWLNALDGSFAYTPNPNFLGTDTFTYQAIDAVSNAPSANTTVTIYVGGYLSIPQNIIGGATTTVAVPVNIVSGNPANSGGLTNATIAINYDPSKLSLPDGPADVTEGTVNSAAGWTNFTVNTNTPGKIVITTSNTGGAAPISNTTGGSLAIINFTLVGVPTGTSVVNISGLDPAVTELDVAGTGVSGNSVPLPFAVAPVDNTNFNGSPGVTDGLISFPPYVTTATNVSATVGGTAVSTVTYGTPVTLTATVVPSSGSNTPGAGSVDFKDGNTDLGAVSTETTSGNDAIFTLITTPNQLHVILASGGVHTITAAYTPVVGFFASTGTLPGGLAVTPASLTITATTNTKTYDATTSAAATPTVAGLVGSDTVTGLAESYTNTNAGSSKTLSVSAYTISDANGANDYTITTVSNTTGLINKAALTITALTNTKTYDSTTSAAATPTVAGLQGADTVTGLAEVYTNANAGSSKTLSVSSFHVNDGNSGNNYTVTTATNTTGVINKAALTITALTNTKNYDATTSAAATPTVAGLQGSDTVTGLTEVYSNAAIGTGKSLSVSAYTVSDGNSGNNYAVTTATNNTGAITVGSFSKYVVSIVGSSTIVAGQAFLFTVQATDAFGDPISNYTGPNNVTINTNPNDPLGNFPVSGPLYSNGFGFFQGDLETAGSYTLTATAGAFSGTSAPFTIVPSSTDHFTVTAPASTNTGSSINVTVTAYDHYGNLTPNYSGTVQLTSTDSAAHLGGPYTFTTSGANPDNGSHTFSVQLVTPGNQTVTATDTTATNPTITGTSSNIVTFGLVVTSFTITPTGFTATFNRPFAPADLTLYGSNLTTVQDVVLRGAHVGPIIGTLLIDPSNQSIVFNGTSSYLLELNSLYDGTVSTALPDDTYIVKLISGSGSNGFIDLAGDHLDGAQNLGHANFVSTFATSYQRHATPVLGIPDFARGPDSGTPIQVPNNISAGIPITFYNAVGVTDVTFALAYNPALLQITGTLSGGSSDATDPAAVLTLVSNAGGVAIFHYQDVTAQSGTLVLGDISAMVPSAAANLYKVKDFLQLNNIVVNHGAIAGVLSGDGVHLNAYFGDVTGDGVIDGVDTLMANTVATGAATGFAAYQLLDPAVIGDVAGDLSLDANDVSAINLYTAHLNPPQIPAPPGFAVTSPNAADPTLSLGEPMGTSTNGDSAVAPVISVMLDHPHPQGSTGLNEAILSLTYDPTELSVAPANITLGSLPGSGEGWQLTSVVDAATGQIGIELYSPTPITATQAGSLVNIAFHVVPGAERPVTPWTAVRLVSAVMPAGQLFGTEVADAQGAMILGPGLDVLVVPMSTDAAVSLGSDDTDATRNTATPASAPLKSAETSVASVVVDSTNLNIGHAADTNEGAVAGESAAQHTMAANIIISGMPAFQPNPASGALMGPSGQVVQIVNVPQANGLPTSSNLSQLADRLFLALARKTDSAGDVASIGGLLEELAPWLESAPDQDQTLPPATQANPHDEIVVPQEGTFSDQISVLDKIFADLAGAEDDFAGLGEY